MIMDSNVGVCCYPLKNIGGIAKNPCLDVGHSMPRVRRNTAYNAVVLPCYRSFPVDAEAYANITRRTRIPELRWFKDG
jgi:hypothetical protein